jgi:capsid protein
MRGVNFSQAKMLETFADRGAARWRRIIREGMLRPIYERWLRWALLEGKIARITPAMERIRFDDPARWEIDPARDGLANERALKLNTSTWGDIVRDTGRDPSVVMAERARELETMRELGIAPPLDPGAKRDDDRVDLSEIGAEDLARALEEAGRGDLLDELRALDEDAA